MINDITSTNEPSSLKSRSILRTSKSNLQLNSHNSSKGANKKSKKKFNSFFKKISIEWNLLLLRLRSISEEIFVTEEAIDELFVEEDTEETICKLVNENKGFSANEVVFLENYKKYQSLDKMCEDHQSKKQEQEDKDYATKNRFTLEDIVRQTSNNQGNADENEVEEEYSFKNLDINSVRKEIENIELVDNSPNSTTPISSKTTLQPNQINFGERLWEIRRSKWLSSKKSDEEIDDSLKKSSIDHIPKELYIKIYNNLVDRSKLLKDGKRINLKDLINIINCGWIAEEKWERAAKGLA